ncbi:hypothetical protein EGH24_05505 [Halonotius terrestris]|uniref:Uncharacterized protein n=1 Tax=Halonotius terrestris TaxID=2487750 RepID=A0A8J8TD67_9EURY|nr:hypothetical protein [Halonotius terrestris]TQQ82894.1 hypothetical protein EGH24_05505 [Halonotius terrestris]
MSTHTPTIEREDLTSFIAVLTRLKQSETAPDQKEILSNAIGRVWDCYDGERFEVSRDEITSDDVETTYRFLEKHGPTREDAQAYREEHKKPHPNRILRHALDFVDAAARYRHGCLPSFRTWTATYIHDGSVIAERTYDYEDSIKLHPVIDDVRYKSTATERDADGTVRVYVSESPFRTDIDVFVHGHTDHTVTVTGHNGPNVATEADPVSTVGAEFKGKTADATEVIVAEDVDSVVAFVEQQGWEYEVNDDVQLPE